MPVQYRQMISIGLRAASQVSVASDHVPRCLNLHERGELGTIYPCRSHRVIQRTVVFPSGANTFLAVESAFQSRELRLRVYRPQEDALVLWGMFSGVSEITMIATHLVHTSVREKESGVVIWYCRGRGHEGVFPGLEVIEELLADLGGGPVCVGRGCHPCEQRRRCRAMAMEEGGTEASEKHARPHRPDSY